MAEYFFTSPFVSQKMDVTDTGYSASFIGRLIDSLAPPSMTDVTLTNGDITIRSHQVILSTGTFHFVKIFVNVSFVIFVVVGTLFILQMVDSMPTEGSYFPNVVSTQHGEWSHRACLWLCLAQSL